MKLLANPVAVLVLALLFSTVPVLGMIWKESAALVHAAVAQKAAAVEASRPLPGVPPAEGERPSDVVVHFGARPADATGW